MHKDDEEEYLAFCSEAMFRIHILELRLNRSVPAEKKGDTHQGPFSNHGLGSGSGLGSARCVRSSALTCIFGVKKPRKVEKSPMGLFQA